MLLPLQTFAIMGGLYAAVNCFMLRLRRKQDGEWRGRVPLSPQQALHRTAAAAAAAASAALI